MNTFIQSILVALLLTTSLRAEEPEIRPIVAKKIFEEAKKNNNWKVAFATGKQEQVVFMCVSPATNPTNEIGMEVHPFDQSILIVEGSGKAILSGKETAVQSGDLIFIPIGTEHNVINTSKELKLISFYSGTDIPSGAVFQKKSDESI
jgi:quercetin dioxygenase-like cupin family protein